MPLLPLIRFRNFAVQLTDNEFFNQFTRSVGRDLITTALFKHFQKNCNQLSTITNIQSNIINQRDGNQQQILSYDCIDKLPSELLSECASYLTYKQYFRFAKCNRNTYIACYAFPSIQKLNLYSIRPNLNLNAFKNIKTLRMSLKQFNALSTSNKSTWCNNHSLRTLELYDGDGNEDDIISFVNCQHLINYHNVTNLSLSGFQSQLIYNIASKFTQLQVLTLDCIDIEFDNNSNSNNSIDNYKNEIKKWFMNLKILHLNENNAGFISDIIEASHDGLEFLSVCDDQTILTNTTFPKLQTLELLYPPNVEILNNSQILKCVTLYSGNEEVMHSFIDNAICKQLALENITITSDNINSFSILQKIESILAKTRNVKRKCKTFCIELTFDDSDPYTDDKNVFGFQILRVINILTVSNINDWRLKIDHCCHDLIDKESLENELNEMKRNYFVEYKINQYLLSIIISNSNK